MKKKITFLIIISMLLLTGCQSKIDVTIDKGMVNENISITLNDDELKTANNVKGEITERVSEYEMDTEVLSYFNIKNYNKNTINVNKNYNLDSYTWDNLIARCYKTQDINFSNNILKISTNGGFNCFNKYNLKGEVVINLKTSYKVISNNADKYENDTYTWNINDNNKNINLEIDTSTVVNEINDNNSKLNIKIDVKVIITILIIIISLGLIFVLITLNKMRKANKI